MNGSNRVERLRDGSRIKGTEEICDITEYSFLYGSHFWNCVNVSRVCLFFFLNLQVRGKKKNKSGLEWKQMNSTDFK